VFAELKKARPDYGFLMEESGAVEGNDKSHRWLVDPLDGTTNFLHGIPHFAVSIGLERDGVPVAGVVYNPITEELFTAERGRGTYVNDRRLRVAARRDLSAAVITCGIPHLGRGDHDLFRRELSVVQAKAAGIRRYGTASLDLAWVAAGRFDGYWERHLSPWDIGAGIVLVREAGGFVSDLAGGDDMLASGDIVAGNEAIQRALLATLKTA
jgi:myo-inositol-1(or 4)-monophosphatase